MNKKPILFVLLFFFTCLGINASSAANYQDWWWSPAQDGMGFNVGQQNKTLLVSWYLYGDDGQSRFLTLSGELRGARLEGKLISAAGPVPGPQFNPAEVSRTEVGNASLTFTSDREATFTYNYEGKTGTLTLQRFTYKTLPLDGNWTFARIGQSSGCKNWRFNGERKDYGSLAISQGPDQNHIIWFDSELDTCSMNVSLSQSGSLMAGSGNISCDSDWHSTAQINRISIDDNTLTIDYIFKVYSGETCTETGTMIGLRR